MELGLEISVRAVMGIWPDSDTCIDSFFDDSRWVALLQLITSDPKKAAFVDDRSRILLPEVVPLNRNYRELSCLVQRETNYYETENHPMDDDTICILEYDYSSVLYRGQSYQLREHEAKVLEHMCLTRAPVQDTTLVAVANREGRLRDVFRSASNKTNKVFGDVIIPLIEGGARKNGWRELVSKKVWIKTEDSQKQPQF
ncbi:hypothetical protein [Novipirellula aureliae]|nr:hypothetical protein [Novipirellula aureliae]